MIKKEILNNKKKFSCNILDCTFRDGGYYNNWSFKKKDINFYISKISKTKIRYIEIGFRLLNNKKSGLTAYSNDNFLRKLKINNSLKIGVMINASDFLLGTNVDFNNLNKIFPSFKYLKFIRIAFHYKELSALIKIVTFFNNKKIKLMVNLMQISELSKSKIIETLRILSILRVDVFYIADSFGSLNPNQIIEISRILKKNCKIKIGFHAHNNLNLSFENSKKAIEENFDYIDSTMLGMGRGAGNLKTEKIYSYLNRSDHIGKSCLNAINKKIFIKLQKKYKWGTNKYYKFAAENSIHPTYIQELLNNNKYSRKDFFFILKSLAKIDSKKYDPENLAQYSDNLQYSEKNPKNTLKEEVLILGSSPSLVKYRKKIKIISKKLNLSIIALNLNKIFEDSFINYRVVSHPKRIYMEYKFYKNFNNKFILPFKKINTEILNYFKKNKVKILNYNLKIVRNENILVKKNICFLPSALALGYAIAFAISRKAKKIYLAGFEGFDKDNFAKDESEKILELFRRRYKNIKIISITPTKYKLNYQK